MGIFNKNITQEGNLIHGQIAVEITHTKLAEYEVCEFRYRSVELVLRLYYYTVNSTFGSSQQLQVLLSFKKLAEDGAVYAATFTSEKLGVTNKVLKTDDGTWRLIYQGFLCSLFDVEIRFNVDEHPQVESCFAGFVDDSELTDVVLEADNGSVPMHRLVLAASSPVLRRMLSGPWKEAADRCVKLPNTTRETLQNLKNFLYLQVLPEVGLEELLQLASCYMITVLESRCIEKLTCNLTPDKACDLLEFAVSSKMKKLTIKVLECVQDKTVDVKQMGEHFDDSFRND